MTEAFTPEQEARIREIVRAEMVALFAIQDAPNDTIESFDELAPATVTSDADLHALARNHGIDLASERASFEAFCRLHSRTPTDSMFRRWLWIEIDHRELRAQAPAKPDTAQSLPANPESRPPDGERQ